MKKVKKLLKDGWKITIEADGDKHFQSYAHRGDFNCPHRKEYDPKDGHGISQVWAEGFKFNPHTRSRTLESSINKLYTKCMKVIPGKKWPPKK